MAQRSVTKQTGCPEARPVATQNLEKRLVKP